MIVKLPFPATFADLMKVEGKAELIGGRIVEQMATGRLPGRIARRITRSLEDFQPTLGYGEVFGDNVGFALDEPLLSLRESFAPDASFHAGPFSSNLMAFLSGAPTFAVEVRSEWDYGAMAEKAIAAKRADYFEAGTKVVWDVDPLAQTVTKYTRDGSTPFALADCADAEPAVPGWRLPLAELFA